MEPAGTPGRKAELGIILTDDEKWTRKGYATEAMHGSVKYAFEELESVAAITIVTDILNEEMRGWAEKVAGLKVKEVIDDCAWYSFTRAEWEDKGGVRERLEIKLETYR
jgi:RimJ/RimL family protein N-acetyltransferase